MATSASNPTKKAIRSPSGPGSGSESGRKDACAGSGHTVKFARRTSNGRDISLSRDDIELSGDLSGDYRNYSVHIPPAPVNHTMDEPVEAQSVVAVKAKEQHLCNLIFTGGSNSETRAHLYLDKAIDPAFIHSQLVGFKGFSACVKPACDSKLRTDDRGNDIHPCDCHFKIYRDYYLDASKDTGKCTSCKEPYHPLHPRNGQPNRIDRMLHLRRRRRSPHLQGYGGGGELREHMGTVLPQTRHGTEKSE